MVKQNKTNLASLNKLKDYVALAIVDGQIYQKTNRKIVAELVSKNIPGVYVTLNKPYENVRNYLKDEPVDISKIIFIDAVTKTLGGNMKKTEDCLFIGSPENLSDISIAMDQAIMAIPKKDKFLFFDSLSTLLLYNSVDVVAKFIHFISGKMRIWKVKGIIISLRREKDKELIEELREYCDIIINLKK